MKTWYMVTLVGKDRAGIVAHVTRLLFERGCNLGEASMSRLGGNFTIMLMVQFDGATEVMEDALRPFCAEWELRAHVDPIQGELHQHVEPDVRITIYGADRAGIVAEATGTLAECGLNITNLETDVAGTEEEPIYIMTIDGLAAKGCEVLERALDRLHQEKQVETELTSIETMMG